MGKLSARLLLTEVLPQFTEELTNLLQAAGRPELASQVPHLVLRDRCRCEDDFCAMFYTAPPPPSGRSWGEGHENVVLEPESGDAILDVVDGRIVAVEVLHRPDIREALEKRLGS